MRSSTLALTLTITWLTTSGALDARAVNSGEADTIFAINLRSSRLTRDITEAQQGAVSHLLANGDTQSLDCLDTLREASSEVSDSLNGVSDLANVASMMRDPADRKYAASVRDAEVDGAVGVLAIERREINRTAGVCPDHALVQSKARDLIQLIDDALTQLGALRGQGG